MDAGPSPLPGTNSSGLDLFVGGPFHRLLAATRLSDQGLRFLVRRCVSLSLLAWLPLLALNAWSGRLRGSETLVLPFLGDVGAHIKFLVALPLLLVAEVLVNQGTRNIARQFLERNLIPERSRQEFNRAIFGARELAGSAVAEAIIVAVVICVSLPLRWHYHLADYVETWHTIKTDGRVTLTPAGLWFVCISLALFHFLLLRWYFRLLVWTRFLWQLSRIRLELTPEHPDRAAGLGFVGRKGKAFVWLAVALGAYFSSLLANQIIYTGDTLPEFWLEIAVFVLFVSALVLGPLTVFAGQLARVKAAALERYDRLSEQYARAFDARWNHGSIAAQGAFLGSADIQSLADLSSVYAAMKGIAVVPFSKQTATTIVVATVAPLVPLLLTMMPWHELMLRLIRLVF